MTALDESEVERWTRRYPAAVIDYSTFERFVADLFRQVGPDLRDYEVRLHEEVEGVDGTFDFDATIRFPLAGMSFLVLVEAKYHKNPIKRDQVQALLAKRNSVGAHKAVMLATAPFQRGAIDFARVHGIALATVIEGRLTLETKSAEATRVSPTEYAQRLGLPVLVAMFIERGESNESTSFGFVAPGESGRVRKMAFGLDVKSSTQP